MKSRRRWFLRCEPDWALVFRRRTVYLSLHFPPWLRIVSILSTMCSLVCMWWTQWCTIFKISLWQTRYKALKGKAPPKLLNLEQMTSWASCQPSFYFQFTVSIIFEAGWKSSNALWTKSFHQAIKVNLSVLLRTCQTSQMFGFRRQTAYSSF